MSPKHSKNLSSAVTVCHQTVPPKREPLISTSLPNQPWEKLTADLFEFKGSTNILLVDYYSRNVEAQKPTTATTASVIAFLKPMFARYGIPNTLLIVIMVHNSVQQKWKSFSKHMDTITSLQVHIIHRRMDKLNKP